MKYWTALFHFHARVQLPYLMAFLGKVWFFNILTHLLANFIYTSQTVCPIIFIIIIKYF